jgi:hypothetical protein
LSQPQAGDRFPVSVTGFRLSQPQAGDRFPVSVTFPMSQPQVASESQIPNPGPKTKSGDATPGVAGIGHLQCRRRVPRQKKMMPPMM